MNIIQRLSLILGGIVQLGISGPKIRDSAGAVEARNAANDGYAPFVAANIDASGDIYASGLLSAFGVEFPAADGTVGQIIATNGEGQLSFVDQVGATAMIIDQTVVNYNSDAAAGAAMFTSSANDVLDSFDVIVVTAFNGTAPTISVGISGTVDKYIDVLDVDLKTVGVYTVKPGLAAQGAEALIATLTADSSSAGQAIIRAHYGAPTSRTIAAA